MEKENKVATEIKNKGSELLMDKNNKPVVFWQLNKENCPTGFARVEMHYVLNTDDAERNSFKAYDQPDIFVKL